MSSNLMMDQPKAFPLVYIIVITHNGKDHLESCLPSVFKTSYPRFRVMLVDNASIDGCIDYVASHFPQVKILRNHKNLGFAKGNNIAIDLALKEGAVYVVLLNDDTAVLDARWLGEAVSAAQEDCRIGMIGFSLTNTLSHEIPTISITRKKVKAIEGCALFIRSSLIYNIGKLDEIYFAYAEESDLEMRAMRAGYNLIELNTFIFHKGAGTSSKYPSKRAYLLMRNVIRYSIKNRGVIHTILKIIRILDVSCNPFPLTFDRTDSTHRGMRNRGNIFLNTLLFVHALIWNVIFLPQTLAIRHQDNLKIKKFQGFFSRVVSDTCRV